MGSGIRSPPARSNRVGGGRRSVGADENGYRFHFTSLASLARRRRGGSEGEARAAETGEIETDEIGSPSVAVLMCSVIRTLNYLIFSLFSGILII